MLGRACLFDSLSVVPSLPHFLAIPSPFDPSWSRFSLRHHSGCAFHFHPRLVMPSPVSLVPSHACFIEPKTIVPSLLDQPGSDCQFARLLRAEKVQPTKAGTTWKGMKNLQMKLRQIMEDSTSARRDDPPRKAQSIEEGTTNNRKARPVVGNTIFEGRYEGQSKEGAIKDSSGSGRVIE